jgi:hypothetical protein
VPGHISKGRRLDIHFPAAAKPKWKTGFEIELLAPVGRSRLDLAAHIARLHGGSVRRFFHAQQEPSKVPGRSTFENLTPGFEALDASGRRLASFVDDVTLQAGLDRDAAPLPGWHRIVTDDGRLLRLLLRHCDPDAPLAEVLSPVARLFGTEAEPRSDGMVKVSDDRGMSVAIAAPLPGERERGCEIVTAPLDDDRGLLGLLLGEARAMGFLVPLEGATHMHFDAGKLMSAGAIANLVKVLGRHGQGLKRLLGTNPHCIRLGKWPEELHELIAQPGFAALDWPAAREALAAVGLQKYCDFNLANIAGADRAKHTFEVRMLPASLEPEPILDAAELFAALLDWCAARSNEAPAIPDDLAGLLASIPLAPHIRARLMR